MLTKSFSPKNRKKTKILVLGILALVLCLGAGALTFLLSNRQGSTELRSQASGGNKKNTPQGYFDAVDNQNCVIAGWTADPDDFKASSKIHVYLDKPYHGDSKKTGLLIGEFMTEQVREDVNKALNTTGNHGFNVSLLGVGGMPKDGKDHKIYIYGINNVGTPGTNVLLGNSPKTLRCSPPPETTMRGTFDGTDNQNCVIAGWVADTDDLQASSKVHVYLDQPYSGDQSKSGKLLGEFTANVLREDVNTYLKTTGKHGFSVSLLNVGAMPKDGKDHALYIYGINKEGTPGSNALLSNTPQTLRCSPPVNPTVQGSFDLANGETCRVYGWTGDSDKVQDSIAIHVYKDKPYAQGGTLIVASTANIARPGVNEKTIFKGNHGFDLSLSEQLKGKGPTQLYIYAINIAGTPGTNVLLSGSPKAIECK